MKLLNAIIVATALCFAVPAWATYSIVACDDRGNCGAAVATNNLAVGATVIYAKAKVGAVASQFETNPYYGTKGLLLLEGGRDPQAALAELVRTDDGFEGQTANDRQVGIVATSGSGAAYTGTNAAAASWSGSLTGQGYSIQGNGLAGGAVLAAMRDAYLQTTGSLAARLMAALEAGEAAGGQTTGRMSAALLIRTPDGGFQDIDLRVDASSTPVADLHRLFQMHQATAAISRAERAVRTGRKDAAREYLAEAVRLGASWDRVWRRVARLQVTLGDRASAVQSLAALANLNPTWARVEMEDPLYATLRQEQGVERSRSPAPRR